MRENKPTWISTRRFSIWTRELQRWLSRKFDSISIDTSKLAQRTDVKDGDDTTIGILKNTSTDAEIYAMFPGAVDENRNINGYWEVNEDGYLVADFTINNGIITLN